MINFDEVLKSRENSILSEWDYNNHQEKLKKLRIYTTTHKRVLSFGNKVTPDLMKYVFGDDGERLWGQFLKYDRRTDKLLTCLTDRQYGDLINHIMYDDELYQHV